MALSKKKTESDAARQHRLELTRGLTFEVIPLKSLAAAIEALPAGAEVSVTCSPAKGIEETQRLTAELAEQGFSSIPHFSARMVRDRAHARDLGAWCRDLGLTKMFLVGGDAPEPGEYMGAVEFLGDFLETDHGLTTIGVTAYPDGHSLLSDDTLHQALHAKQDMLTQAGIAGYASTQMCFDPETITSWLRRERTAGLTLPVHLGIAGVVDKTKLVTMGARLGIGDSVKYLRKNMGAMVKMMTSLSYDPNDLLVPMSEDLGELDVEGLHVFTFNQVGATADWQAKVLAAS